MPDYRLNVLLSPKDTATIFDAGQEVVLLKKSSAGNPVAWVTFQPFEQNYVSWHDDYALYASNTQIVGGATIKKISDVSAVPKQIYAFNKGTFAAPESDPDILEGQYAVTNKMNGYDSLVFGLAQEVEYNGVVVPASPINASLVPLNQRAKFIPYEIVTIFLEAYTDTGTVVTDVVSTALVVTFGGSVTEITVQYDSSIGGFKQL